MSKKSKNTEVRTTKGNVFFHLGFDSVTAMKMFQEAQYRHGRLVITQAVAKMIDDPFPPYKSNCTPTR